MKSKFRSLKKKIFLQVVLTVAVAAAVGSFLLFVVVDGVLQNPFAESFIRLCERILRLSPESAKTAYYALFQRFKPIWIGVGFVLLLLVIFYFALTRMTRYFDRLSEALDHLADDTDEEIRLPAELDFMEKRLNAVRQTLRKREKDAKEAEQRKNDLVVYLAHDIKTPLTSIINYVDLLKKEDIEDERVCSYIEVLDRQSRRLKKLTEDVLEASKASTGNMAVELARTEVAEMLNQVAGEYAERFADAQLHPVIDISDAEGSVIMADGRLLWRVFDNLLNNICKYSQPETRVYFSVRHSESEVMIAMKNISRDVLNISADELIERFVRGDSARSSEGSGLGLSIAQSLTELQGGRFELFVDGDLFKAVLSFPRCA